MLFFQDSAPTWGNLERDTEAFDEGAHGVEGSGRDCATPANQERALGTAQEFDGCFDSVGIRGWSYPPKRWLVGRRRHWAERDISGDF
jgi:hypothetical protein